MIVDEWPLGFLGTDRRDYAGDRGGVLQKALRALQKTCNGLAHWRTSTSWFKMRVAVLGALHQYVFSCRTAGRIVVVTTGMA